MYIYVTENLLNGRKYVGKCMRKASRTVAYLGSGMYLNNAIRKHGKEHFKKTILEEGILTRESLAERERYWIAQMDTRFPKGYNLTNGGDGGGIVAPEIEKLRAAKIGNAHRGKVIPQEMRDRIAATLKARPRLTDEELMARRARMKKPYKNRGRGSKRPKGMPYLGARKPIVQIDMVTGQFVASFPSISAARDATGIIGIGPVVAHERRFAGGFVWMTQSEYDAHGPFAPEQIAERIKLEPYQRSASLNRQIGLNQPNRRDVVQLDKHSNPIAVFPSASVASEHTGIDKSVIAAVANGNVCQSSAGIWMFADEYEVTCASGARLPMFQPMPPHANSKAVVQLATDGRVIATFSSATEASNSLGGRPKCSDISACVNGRQKTAGGYRWTFKSDTTNQIGQPILNAA